MHQITSVTFVAGTNVTQNEEEQAQADEENAPLNIESKDFNFRYSMNSYYDLSSIFRIWRLGLVVARWPRSTKLLYAQPG